MKKKILKTLTLSAGIMITTAFLPGDAEASDSISVKSGDSLWKISQAYNVEIQDIIEANNLTSINLYVGQTLVIPSEDNYYTVQPGDTLWIISQKLENTTIQSLRDLNNLSTDMLYIGQQLKTASDTKSNNTYTVQSGDSLWIISQKFNITINQLMEWNNMNNQILYVGQTLTLVKPEVSMSTAQQLIITAKQYMGVPYVWGGGTPSGFDCSGFLNYVFTKHGISIPRTVATIYEKGTFVNTPQIGDLVFFETYKPGASHAGIYIGNRQFIHASSSKGITISSMDNVYWSPRYIGAKNYY